MFNLVNTVKLCKLTELHNNLTEINLVEFIFPVDITYLVYSIII